MHFKNTANAKFSSTLKIGNDINEKYRLKIKINRTVERFVIVCGC